MTSPHHSSAEIDLYRAMLLIRRTEEYLADRYRQQEMRCPMHLCIGQEAVAAGVCMNLAAQDLVFSNHRAHGHYLAKGGSLEALIAEIYGKAGGCAGGFGGSMHLVDRKAGFMGSTPIVGGTVPLAVGAAWSGAALKTRRLAVAFFGDGCFEEGVMHECLNFAALKKLPLLFVCENNAYSVYTPLEARQPKRPIHQVAAAHGWSAGSADGNDVREVYRTAKDAIEKIRAGKGPQFLEYFTYRWREHCGPEDDDHLGYRPGGELERWQKRCPIEVMKTYLLEQRIATTAELERICHLIDHKVEAAFTFATQSPDPACEHLSQKVYAATGT